MYSREVINAENYYLEAVRSPSVNLTQKRFSSIADNDFVSFPDMDIFANQAAGQVRVCGSSDIYILKCSWVLLSRHIHSVWMYITLSSDPLTSS